MNFKLRSILATHAFNLVEIKRSWHTEDGSETVGDLNVSVTIQIPSKHRVNGQE